MNALQNAKHRGGTEDRGPGGVDPRREAGSLVQLRSGNAPSAGSDVDEDDDFDQVRERRVFFLL